VYATHQLKDPVSLERSSWQATHELSSDDTVKRLTLERWKFVVFADANIDQAVTA
jgi:hypothetical protein